MFVVTSFGFGLYLDRGGAPGDVVPAGVVAAALCFVAALAVRPVGEAPPAPRFTDAVRLVLDPRFAAFLGAAALHWAALSPFHLFFALHLESLDVLQRWVGAGFAAGVLAEVAVMWWFRDLARVLPWRALFFGAFGVSALRWVATALATTGPLLAGLQVLHGITFGAFFIASIAHLEAVVPESLRATGRALFASVVFGAGSVLGNALAGVLFDASGAGAGFWGAVGLEALATLVFLGVRRVRS